jgi:coproporphyrinogen III oxidase-like Fe-S oxidoreductase
MVFKSFDTLRAAGFGNLNLDLMFAIPGQTLTVWRETLREALALGSEHLSCYEVIYEEDTPLFEQLKAGQFDVDEELACTMYDELIDTAGGRGFQQYEIANFARQRSAAAQEPGRDAFHRVPTFPPELTAEADRGRRILGLPVGGFVSSWPTGEGWDAVERVPASFSAIPALACRHNVNYWRGGSYYGLGPSAAGYVSGVRTKNWSNTNLYCDLLERGQRAIESRDALPPLARAGETAAFGLRMNVGWRFDEFERVTGFDLREHWTRELEELSRLGWGELAPDGFRLTRQGLRFADAAAERFLRSPRECVGSGAS